jgi:hypothetical protein
LPMGAFFVGKKIVGSCNYSVSLCFYCSIETINIQSYYWKACSNSCHFVVFVVLDPSLLFICLSTRLVRLIVSQMSTVAFIFLFCI